MSIIGDTLGALGTRKQEPAAQPFPSVVEPRTKATPDDLIINVSGGRIGLGWKIATVVLAILVVVCAGLAVYFAMKRGQQEAETDDYSEQVTALEAEIKDDEAVREITQLLDQKLQEMLVLGEQRFEAYATYNSDPIVVYQLENVPALVGLTRTYGSYVPRQENEALIGRFVGTDEVKVALISVLTEQGFRKYDYAGWYGEQYLNAETGVMCAISEPRLPYSYQCGHIQTANTDNLELVKALGEALMRAEMGVRYIDTSQAEVKTSLVRPYQKVSVGLLGATGIFYRRDPNEPWQFFTAAQGMTPCSDYNTDDLRKAFAGEACLDMETGEMLKVTL